MRICLSLFGVVALFGSSSAAPAADSASLIYAGWYGNTIPTPTFVRDHKSFLETRPFDGLVVYLRHPNLTVNVTRGTMTTTAYSYDTIASVLAPLTGLTWTTLTQNLALVQGSTPPDFFDSWTVTVQNFANLARALKEAGLKGICFDNEQYSAPWGNYPTGVKYTARTLAEYQLQARLRGREVMAAMAAQFPGIAVVTLHGPYVSEPKAPSSLGFPQWQSGNELLGPFFSGFMEGAGTSAVNSDGGELYTLRTASQFQASYDWRRYTLASDTINCVFIPPALRPVWPDRSSIAFGVYDRPFGGASMDPTIARTTIANALRTADRFVWFYTEGSTFLLPASQGGASDTWVDAVRLGKADGQTSPTPTAPAAPGSLTASATSTSAIDLAWTDLSTNETEFEIDRKMGASGTWSQIATTGANAVSHQDTGLASGTSYTYRVRATNGAGDSAPSNEATATTPADVVIPVLTSFTLLDADTDLPVAGYDPFLSGTTLNLRKLPTRRLNVRANPTPSIVGSMKFGYDGNPNVNIENIAPYALASDVGPGDYLPWTPTVGSHSIVATPYTGYGSAGTAGVSKTVTFTVVDQPRRLRDESGVEVVEPEPAAVEAGGGSGGSCGLLGAEWLVLWGAIGLRRRRTVLQ